MALARSKYSPASSTEDLKYASPGRLLRPSPLLPPEQEIIDALVGAMFVVWESVEAEALKAVPSGLGGARKEVSKEGGSVARVAGSAKSR